MKSLFENFEQEREKKQSRVHQHVQVKRRGRSYCRCVFAFLARACLRVGKVCRYSQFDLPEHQQVSWMKTFFEFEFSAF